MVYKEFSQMRSTGFRGPWVWDPGSLRLESIFVPLLVNFLAPTWELDSACFSRACLCSTTLTSRTIPYSELKCWSSTVLRARVVNTWLKSAGVSKITISPWCSSRALSASAVVHVSWPRGQSIFRNEARHRVSSLNSSYSGIRREYHPKLCSSPASLRHSCSR